MPWGERIFHTPGWAELDDWLALGWHLPPQHQCWRFTEYGPHVEWICECRPAYPTSYKGRRYDPTATLSND